VVVERVGLDQPLIANGDAGRLEQVLLNLLLNAARAMDGQGRITIRGSRGSDASGARWIELAVEDEGSGIAPADLGRLFDPFFSASGGTGLGLSVSYGIVKAHGGTLTAANRSTRGACLTLRLPAEEMRA
jgi:two-component system, NtrC family, sensor kinase